MTSIYYPDELELPYHAAYEAYITAKTNWTTVTETCRNRLRRQMESTLHEAGFRGTCTNLWSQKRYESRINELNGIPPTTDTRMSIEHPIPPRVIALHIISLPKILSKEEYFKIWFENYVFVETTNEENQRLKTLFQKHMKFGDCWKKMYAAAGIVLVDKPVLISNDDKIRHGVIIKPRVKK